MLTIRDLVAGYQASSEVLRGVDLEHRGGRDRRPDGPQRHGQNDAARRRSWATCRSAPGPSASTERELVGLAADRDRAAIRHRLCAAGPRDLRRVHRRGESAPGVLGKRTLRPPVPAALCLVPDAPSERRQQRRHHVGRRAAAAGDRPRADRLARALLLDEPSEGIQPSIVQAIGTTLGAIAARSA